MEKQPQKLIQKVRPHGGGTTTTTTVITTQRINQKINTHITTTTTTYQQGVSEEGVQDKVEDFVKLLKTPFKNPGTNMKASALGKLENGSGIFFNMLKNGDRTQDLEDLMRYILYKATGKSYGITEFNFDIFKIKDFNKISSNNLLEEYLIALEGTTPISEDGTKYQVKTDYGVGHGIDIDDGGYWADFNAAGYTNVKPGDWIDKEFVDGLFRRTMMQKLKNVRDKTSGLELTGYQINALVIRSYNYDNTGVFVGMYKKYWDQERDDMFELKVTKPDFNHALYKNYMKDPIRGDDPNTGENKILPGLVNRRNSEWTLFQTGYYDKLNKWHSDTSSLVDAAYEVADHFMNGVTVHYAGDSVPEAPDNGRQCVSGNIQGAWDYPVQNPNRYGVVCATYVSLALWRSGIIDEATINSIGYNGCTDLQRMLTSGAQKDRWQKITNVNDLQEGDIVFHTNYNHVLIYVGDGKCIDQNYCTMTSRGNDYRGNLVGVGSFLEAYRFIGK